MARGLNILFEGYTGNLIIVWKLAASPLAEVDRSAAKPFPVTEVFTPPNIKREAYIFEFWQSANGITLDFLIRTWTIDGDLLSKSVVKRYEYQVGRGLSETDDTLPYWEDPAIDAIELIDERLDGATKAELDISFRGTGSRHAGEYDLRTGGGIQLVTGETFQQDDWIFITHYQQEVSVPTDTGSDYDITEIEDDIIFGTTHHNKILVANFATTIGTIDFPAFNTITDCKFKVTTFGGSQRYVKLQFAPGDTVRFLNQDFNVLYLGKDEVLEGRFKNNKLYIENYQGCYNQVGNTILCDRQPVNTMLNDPTVLHDATDFARLIQMLKPEQIATPAQWNSSVVVTIAGNIRTYYPYRAKFYLDTSVTPNRLRFPERRALIPRALKYFDGTNDPERLIQGVAGLQAQDIIEHGHGIAARNMQGNTNIATVSVYDTNVNVADVQTKKTGGSEVRMDNYGQLSATVI